MCSLIHIHLNSAVITVTCRTQLPRRRDAWRYWGCQQGHKHPYGPPFTYILPLNCICQEFLTDKQGETGKDGMHTERHFTNTRCTASPTLDSSGSGERNELHMNIE